MDAHRRAKTRASLRNTCELADDVDEGEKEYAVCHTPPLRYGSLGGDRSLFQVQLG